MTVEAATATETLTKRERELVALLMTGMTNWADLCDHLVISRNTLHFHLSSIMRKLNVCDRAQLGGYAFQNGVVVEGEWYPRA